MLDEDVSESENILKTICTDVSGYSEVLGGYGWQGGWIDDCITIGSFSVYGNLKDGVFEKVKNKLNLGSWIDDIYFSYANELQSVGIDIDGFESILYNEPKMLKEFGVEDDVIRDIMELYHNGLKKYDNSTDSVYIDVYLAVKNDVYQRELKFDYTPTIDVDWIKRFENDDLYGFISVSLFEKGFGYSVLDKDDFYGGDKIGTVENYSIKNLVQLGLEYFLEGDFIMNNSKFRSERLINSSKNARIGNVSENTYIPYDLVSMRGILRDYAFQMSDGSELPYLNNTHKLLVDIADSVYNLGSRMFEKFEGIEKYQEVLEKYSDDFWKDVLDDMSAIDTQLSRNNAVDLAKDYYDKIEQMGFIWLENSKRGNKIMNRRSIKQVRRLNNGYSNNADYVGDWYGKGQIDFDAIINPKDDGDLYMVKMWSGSGYSTDVYLCKANDIYDAIDIVFEWSYQNEGANNIVFDYNYLYNECQEYFNDEYWYGKGEPTPSEKYDGDFEAFFDDELEMDYVSNDAYSLFARSENFFVDKVDISQEEYEENQRAVQRSRMYNSRRPRFVINRNRGR